MAETFADRLRFKVAKDCPYLDMKDFNCSYSEGHKSYKKKEICLKCRIALYHLWEADQKKQHE